MPRIMAYPMSMLPTLGFMICMVGKYCTAFWGGINYRPWVLMLHSGSHSGKINAPWKIGILRLGLGLARRYGSFAILLCELCLWFALWCEVLILIVLGRYVLRSGFDALVLWFQLGGLAYSSSALWFVVGCRVLRAWVMGIPGGQHVTLHG